MSADATRIIQGNALNLPLEDESVDLIITSPPYFALRSYRDGDEHYEGQIGSEPTPAEFLEALWAATREMVRVLKPTGSIWVNLGDKYAGSGGHNNNGIGSSILTGHGGQGTKRDQNASYRRNAPDRYNQNSGGIPAKSLMGLPWRYAIGCIDQLGLILRAEVVWSKPNGLPESVTDRVRRSHEQWFHMVKSPKYFAAVDEVREPHSENTHARSRTATPSEGHAATGHVQTSLNGDAAHPLGKLPGSVWTIPSEPLIIPDAVKEHYDLPDHFAAFPQEWPRRIILGWSPTAICVECGEGRRPVVEKQYLSGGDKFASGTAIAGRHDSGKRMGDGVEATITGYACACRLPSMPTALGEKVAGDGVSVGMEGLPPTRPAVVLDPFAGTGTVPMVARALGRIGIGVELSHDYCRLANWRVFQSGHASKTESRTNQENQGGLF